MHTHKKKPLLVFLAFWIVITLINLCQDVRLKAKKGTRKCVCVCVAVAFLRDGRVISAAISLKNSLKLKINHNNLISGKRSVHVLLSAFKTTFNPVFFREV